MDFRHLHIKVKRLNAGLVFLLSALSCASVLGDSAAAPGEASCQRSWTLLNQTSHNESFFTQGLLMLDGTLYESTGQYGQSAVIKQSYPAGKLLGGYRLPSHLFGEGLAFVGERFVQLTWRARTALIYDRDLKPLHTLAYSGEGWGLSAVPDGEHDVLALSDGTDVLRFLNPETFEVIRTSKVTENGKPVSLINELEWTGSELLANIWHSDRVIAIDPASGQVTAWFNFSKLRKHLQWSAQEPSETDLNGLAIDRRNGHLLVTGKYWPSLFEVRMGPCME